MKKAFGFFSAVMLAGQAALAANIFVPQATGDQLSQEQRQQVTDMVKSAVEGHEEHSLVQSEQEAEIVLQPSIVQRGGNFVLRIEKQRDGQLTAVSEQSIPSADVTENQARTITQATLDEGAQAEQQGMMAGGGQQGGEDTQSGMTEGADSPAAQGDVRAPSPMMAQRQGNSFFQIGVGPAFGIGMESDRIMYNIHGGYNYNINEQITGKVIADFNLGTGSDTARMISLLAGADWVLQDMSTAAGLPYVTGEIGFGSARNANDVVENGPVIGLAGGFKFAAQQLNWDVNLHYTIMTSQLEGRTPSVLGLRAAIGF
jgi:hypothetical protein